MSFSNNLTQISNTRLSATGKSTLNPNATEFVPSFSAATLPGASCAIEVSVPITSHLPASNAVLDRSKSSVSNNSDEEARQYWSCQLPDDITPDFNDEELKGIESLSLEGLSLEEATDGLRFASSTSSRIPLNQQQEVSPHHNGNSFIISMRTPASFLNANAKAWEAPTSKKSLVIDNSIDNQPSYSGNTGDFIDTILSDSGIVDANEVDSLSFLANQFPGFAYESLAEAFFANQHDLNLTVEMLTQLELQVDGGFSKVTNSKSSSTLNPNAPVFHSHTMHEGKNSRQNYTRDGRLQIIDPYQPSDQDSRLLFSPTSSISTKGFIDLDSGIRKLPLQKSNSWKYEGNGSVDMGIGSSRRSDLLASYKSQESSFAGSVHPQLREEVPHHAGLLNTYLQQVKTHFDVINVLNRLRGRNMKRNGNI
uniref:Uncharacterized protein n=1 Tax=Kalanchoe fedtschenkoi TaxID=63787 RepID=A0A7N0ZYZ2_KALFE